MVCLFALLSLTACNSAAYLKPTEGENAVQIVGYGQTNLVKHHRGTMPIVLTCPHDGTAIPPNVRERTDPETPASCTGMNKFSVDRDGDIAPITEGVAQKILDLTGLSPYVVIATFSRRFIDANRRPECAFVDPAARVFYEQYHYIIRTYVSEILSQNENKGFLFDMHGTREKDDEPADIYLGTRNGRSLIGGFSHAMLFMQHGLYGLLNLQWSKRHTAGHPGSYRISPRAEGLEERINGGFTIEEYSSLISGIQIEIANPIRFHAEVREPFKEDLAFALINFVRRYAPF